MALAFDRDEYVPPKTVAEMEEKYAPVLKVIDDGTQDFIVWGWDRAIRRKLLKLGADKEKLPSDEQLDDIRRFSSREFCVEFCENFYKIFNRTEIIVPNNMRVLDEGTTETDLGDEPVIIKQLWSSSGRGNRVVTNSLNPKPNVLSQRCVVDKFYNKTLDFAMEFQVEEDDVKFLGYSVFSANREGKYKFNYVAQQKELEAMILKKCTATKTELDNIRDTHISLLKVKLRGRYKGPVGIDMLVTTNGLVHPCIELNLRMNMGILALAFFLRFGNDRLREMSLDSLLDFISTL